MSHSREIFISFLVLLTVGLGYVHTSPTVVAASEPPSGLMFPSLAPTQSQPARSPVVGQLSVVVIGVEFQDLRHTRPISDIQQLVFKDLARYWHDVSYGKVTLTGKVVGWVTASQTFSSYLASDSPQTEYSLILDAVNQVGSQVDFRQYEYVIAVHAGHDRAYTLSKNDLYNVNSLGMGTVTTKDGPVTVGVSLVAEFDPLGPYAHELGANFGLPDLWNHYILNSACPYCDNFVGEWDVMAHGFWANNGSTPVQPSVWSKLQLGWLDGSQVITAGGGTATNVTVTPLDTARGVKAVKFPLTATTYYLLEVRRRVGWDLYLPDEGVIIYYVNTALGSGLGPVRVQPSVDMAKAAWKVGQTFAASKGGGIGVYIAAEASDSFKVDYSVGLASFSFTLTVNTIDDLPVNVDGRQYRTGAGGQLVLANQTWGVHNVSVPDAIPVSDGVRLGFAGWGDGVTGDSRMVLLDRDLTLTTNYQRQYLLSVNSPLPVEGGGWHDANSTVSILVQQPILDGGNGTRHVFTGWTGDATGTGNVTSILMNGPKSVTANWKQQFSLRVESDYGTPQGAGWYDIGSTVVVTVQPTVQIMPGEREVFTGWSGDASDASPSVTLHLNFPTQISANWKTQHLIQIVVVDSHGMPVSSPQPRVEFTNGASMLVSGERVWLDSGSYAVTEVTWHGIAVDSADTQLVYETSPNAVWNIRTNIFTVRVALKGILTGLSANGAFVTIRLPDGETITATTSNGVATFRQIPAGQYSAVLSAGFITKSFQLDVRGDVDASFTMLLPIELVAVAAVFLAIVGTFCILRGKL